MSRLSAKIETRVYATISTICREVTSVLTWAASFTLSVIYSESQVDSVGCRVIFLTCLRTRYMMAHAMVFVRVLQQPSTLKPIYTTVLQQFVSFVFSSSNARDAFVLYIKRKTPSDTQTIGTSQTEMTLNHFVTCLTLPSYSLSNVSRNRQVYMKMFTGSRFIAPCSIVKIS